MSEQILVPIDGSPQAETALRFALDRHPDAAITVLYVAQIGYDSEMGVVEYLSVLREEYDDRADDLFDSARAIAEEFDRTVRTEKRGGTPWAVIVTTAEEEFDHVILGSTGRHGASRLLLGSVAEQVVRRSPVPVTVVR